MSDKVWRNAAGLTLEELKAPDASEADEPAGVGRPDGLTEAEGAVMDALTDAARGFSRLPVEHPADLPDFIAAIHRCQEMLAVRVARRAFPDGWPTRS